jgi:hypothetical protein
LKSATPAPQGYDLSVEFQSSKAPFIFALAVGGFEGGVDLYRVVRIDSDGQCTYDFPEETSPQRSTRKSVSFRLSETDLEQLKDVLLKNRYWTLSKSYQANLVDGTCIILKCDFQGNSKTVTCYNYFPDEVVRIHDYLLELVVERHAREVKNATPSGPDSGVDSLYQSRSGSQNDDTTKDELAK